MVTIFVLTLGVHLNRMLRFSEWAKTLVLFHDVGIVLIGCPVVFMNEF